MRNVKFAYIALFLSSFIWGIASPVIKITLNYISPVQFLFFRFLLASIIMLIPVILKLKSVNLSKNDLLLYLFLGFLSSPLNLILIFWGINRTTAIDASLISVTKPIIVIIGSILFLKEKVTKIEFLGIFIAVFGTILTIIQPLINSSFDFLKNIQGNLLVLAGTIVWAAFTLITKKVNKKIDSLLLVGISFLVGLVVITPMSIFENGFHLDTLFSINPKAIPGIIFMSIFSSVAAYWAYTYGLKKIEASKATVFTYLQPLFGIPVSIVFLKESLTLSIIIGALLIITGVFISERFN